MAAKKKKGGRQGLFSKVINILLLALTFSRPIQIMAFQPGNLQQKMRTLVRDLTFGMVDTAGTVGRFSLSEGLRMWAPPAAAAGLGILKRYALKHYPVRK